MSFRIICSFFFIFSLCTVNKHAKQNNFSSLPSPGHSKRDSMEQGIDMSDEVKTRGFKFSFCCSHTVWPPCVLSLVAQACPTPCNSTDCSPPGSSVHGASPGRSIGAGRLSLLQGIFSPQGPNPGLPHCRWICLPSEPGKPLVVYDLRAG